MDDRGEARRYAAAPAAYLLLFLGLPVVYILVHATGAAGGASLLDAARELATKPYYRNRILFTLGQAAGSTALTLLLGVPLAYIFSHYSFVGRGFLRALLTVPFVLPAIVVALALHAYVGPRSILGIDLLTPLGPVGSILLAHVLYNTSLVMRLVGNQWERLPPTLVEAGRTLGGSPRQVLRRVELPLILPAILAAAVLVFIFNLTTFGVVLLLAGDRIGTMETLIYEELRSFRPDYATASALALLQLVVTYAALTIFVVLQRRMRAAWTPDPRPRRKPLRVWALPVLGLATLVLAGPPLALVASSLRFGGSWTLHPYELLFTNATPIGAYTAGTAVVNSVGYAAATLVVGLALAWLAALAVHRARRGAWAEGFLLLPLGISSVVVGLGLLTTWDGRLLPDLRTSPLRIIAAHVLIAFPFASRILAPALDAVPSALRDTARTLGATRSGVVRFVDLPMAYPALGVGAVYTFAASLGEFGAALTLRRPETVTLPLAIFDAFGRVGAPFHAQAAALATLLVLVALAGFLLLERLRVRAWGGFG